MRIEQFQKHAAVLDQVLADLARPKNLHQKAPIPLAVVLPRNHDPNFLTLQAARADQSNPRGRNVAAQELNLAVIRQENFRGLDKWHAAMLASFHVGGADTIIVNDLTDGLLHFALLPIIAGAGVDDGNVIISAVAMVKKCLSQDQDVLPVSFRESSLGQRFPNLTPNDKSLTAGPLDDLFGYPLQVG